MNSPILWRCTCKKHCKKVSTLRAIIFWQRKHIHPEAKLNLRNKRPAWRDSLEGNVHSIHRSNTHRSHDRKSSKSISPIQVTEHRKTKDTTPSSLGHHSTPTPTSLYRRTPQEPADPWHTTAWTQTGSRHLWSSDRHDNADEKREIELLMFERDMATKT
jgi:hypothetical protein